jgi:hypothetical protein
VQVPDLNGRTKKLIALGVDRKTTDYCITREAWYVQRNNVTRSRNIYTSEAILTA